MAKMIQAYRRYGPQIVRGTTANLDEVSAYIAESTGLDKHEIRMVLGKLHDAVLHYAQQGRGVKLEGLLSLWPTMNTKGQLSFGRRFAPDLGKAINVIENFHGRIDHYEHRDWTEEDYRNAWNEEFPDDVIES